MSPLLPQIDPITQIPILILYPHNRCNCRCVMCDIWRLKDRQELYAAEIAAWLAEWRELGVRRIVFSGGEALLHSNLWELCELLTQAGIGITLLSTGLLLRREAHAIATYCDDVIVSLDGPPEIHDRIRNVPRAFARMEEGVAALKAVNSGLLVSGRCTVQQANFKALRATVRTARAMGLDRISFLAADTHSEAFNRPGGWEPERVEAVGLTPADMPFLEAELQALEQEHSVDFADDFIAESPAKLRRRLLAYFGATLGLNDFPQHTCNAPWVSSVIEADGTIRPCFFQPPLGNIREAGSLQAVLNAPESIAFRKRLDVETDAICRRCVCTLSLRESPNQGLPGHRHSAPVEAT